MAVRLAPLKRSTTLVMPSINASLSSSTLPAFFSGAAKSPRLASLRMERRFLLSVSNATAPSRSFSSSSMSSRRSDVASSSKSMLPEPSRSMVAKSASCAQRSRERDREPM